MTEKIERAAGIRRGDVAVVSKMYAETIGEILKVDRSPLLTSRSLKSGVIMVTQLDCARPSLDPSAATEAEDAFAIGAWNRGVFEREMWLDGKPVGRVESSGAECFTFLDLRQRISALFMTPFSAMAFYLPRAVINEISLENGGQIVEGLNLQSARPQQDPVISALSQALEPAMLSPGEASPLYVDHVTRALAMHVAQAYGGVTPEPYVRGGLSPSHQRRLLEMLDANLGGDITLAEMARECGISTRHLTRAFRESLGVPPHRWLIERRIDRARDLLQGTRLSLDEIAIACGFADQSHFTRVFTKKMNVSPMVWRRATGRP